jgi:hypothetical protein
MKSISEHQREPRRASPQYVIARCSKGSLELLRIPLRAGEKALPIFSFEELAQGFLKHRGLGPEWYIKKSYNGEMISLLLGPCTDVERILPNPLPDPLVAQGALLNSMDRKRFMDFLLTAKKS